MTTTHKHISKYTGNLCFNIASDSGNYLFEVNRKAYNIYHQSLNTSVEGICYENFNGKNDSYLVSIGNYYLYQYSNNTIETDYIYTYPYRFFVIKNGKDGFFYGIDKFLEKIIKFSVNPFVVKWEYKTDSSNGIFRNIIYRDSNNTLVYNDNNDIYILRDNMTSCSFINKTTINGQSKLSVLSSGEFNPEYAFVKYSIVSKEDLDQSSSSSYSSSSTSLSSISSRSSLSSGSSVSSSSLSSLSSDSSSFGYSESSDSSSFGYSESSDSSSFGYSESSDSSSFGYSSSSSLGINIPVKMFTLGWEHDNYDGSDYDYNDIYQDIYIFNENHIVLPKMKLEYVATDSSGENAFKIKSMSIQQSTIRIVTRYGLNSTQEQIRIYKNGVEQTSFVIFAGSPNINTDIVVKNDDEISIRLTSFYNPPNVLDIYQWQLFAADNRIRAKVTYYE